MDLKNNDAVIFPLLGNHLLYTIRDAVGHLSSVSKTLEVRKDQGLARWETPPINDLIRSCIRRDT
jgi:hypothetical protein